TQGVEQGGADVEPEAVLATIDVQSEIDGIAWIEPRRWRALGRRGARDQGCGRRGSRDGQKISPAIIACALRRVHVIVFATHRVPGWKSRPPPGNCGDRSP